MMMKLAMLGVLAVTGFALTGVALASNCAEVAALRQLEERLIVGKTFVADNGVKQIFGQAESIPSVTGCAAAFQVTVDVVLADGQLLRVVDRFAPSAPESVGGPVMLVEEVLGANSTETYLTYLTNAPGFVTKPLRTPEGEGFLERECFERQGRTVCVMLERLVDGKMQTTTFVESK